MPKFAHFLYLIPLTASAILSVKVYFKGWAKPFRWFSLFLLTTMIVEWLAVGWKLYFHQTTYWSFSKSNLWIYNLYIIPEYLFYIAFYCIALDGEKFKRIIWPIGISYLFFSMLNIICIQGMSKLNTYTIVLGGLIAVLFAANYFVQELRRKIPVKVHSQPLFWISLGVLIFHSVSLPNFIFINYLSRTNQPLATALFNIVIMLNIFMYSSYLIAFLCRTPTRKKSFSQS